MKKSELKSGVILSYINLGLSMLIPFFYTPVMLNLLGKSEYGLYSLSSSAVSYLSLLSFGFGSTIIRYIAKYRAEGKKAEEEKTFGFFLLLYCALAALVMICGLIIANNVEPIFHRGLSSIELSKMKKLVLIMAFNSALSFPVSVFSSIIIAHEKYIFRKLIDMISTVAAPMANLVALYLGYASVGMAVAATVVQVTMLPVSIAYCLKTLDVKPQFTILPSNLIHEMLGFSVFIFIGSIVDMLFWSTDKVILGMLASSTAVAVYNIGATFNNMVMNLSTSMSGVLMPRITAMSTQNGNQTDISNLFIKVGRLQYIIIALVVSGFTVFGQAFINLWTGPDYADSYWIAILTMFPLCIPLIQNTGHSIVVAQNKHQFRSIVYLIIAIINVISTYLLVPKMGGIGAALCSCIAYLLGQGLAMNWYYYKVMKIDIPLFWKNIGRMSIVPGVMLLVGLLLKQYISINNWLSFFVLVIGYTAVYGILTLKYSMNEYEKSLLLSPVKRILNK